MQSGEEDIRAVRQEIGKMNKENGIMREIIDKLREQEKILERRINWRDVKKSYTDTHTIESTTEEEEERTRRQTEIVHEKKQVNEESDWSTQRKRKEENKKE